MGESVTLMDAVATTTFGPYTAGGFSFTIMDAAGCQAELSQTTFPCDAALSVELIEFTGRVQDDGNLLNWSTASEINSKNFVLQQSIDGTQFSVINVQESAGNSNSRQDYSFLDMNAPAGVSYYRLMEISQDGVEKIYGVIALDRGSSNDFGLTGLYPNPVKEIMNIDFETSLAADVTVEIYDAVGRLLQTQVVASTEGENSTSIDLSVLSAGFYFVHLKQNNSSVTTRFTKE